MLIWYYTKERFIWKHNFQNRLKISIITSLKTYTINCSVPSCACCTSKSKTHKHSFQCTYRGICLWSSHHIPMLNNCVLGKVMAVFKINPLFSVLFMGHMASYSVDGCCLTTHRAAQFKPLNVLLPTRSVVYNWCRNLAMDKFL